MELRVQKRLAAQVMKCSEKRVIFDPSRLDEIKEAITKVDIRNLIKDGAIVRRAKKGVSRFRARKIRLQKSKGKRKGHGSRKGTFGARSNRKSRWVAHVRLQREFIRELKNKKIINNEIYRNLYMKIKGGFFRSKRHIKLYMEEKGISKK